MNFHFITKRRVLKRELNKQERASDAGMKSAAMGVIPFQINDDLRTQLEAFGGDESGDINWIEMVGLLSKCVYLYIVGLFAYV